MDWRIAGPKSAVLYPYVIRILDWLRIGNRNLSFFLSSIDIVLAGHWQLIGIKLTDDWPCPKVQTGDRLASNWHWSGTDWR